MAKRKFVLRLHIHDVVTATVTMTREQKGLYLDCLVRYANGFEIPANVECAAKVLNASVDDAEAVVERFGTTEHEKLEDQERYGDRIYDERIEPLHVSNRAWRW